MDVSIVVPMVFQRGGSDRIVLEMARHFNAPVYTALYRKETAFSEFADLDVREIRYPLLKTVLSPLGRDVAIYGSALASAEFLTYKIKGDYDVLNAHGNPGNWIRNRNPRVCWSFYGPVRSAFDLYKYKVANLPLHKRIPKESMFAFYKFWDKRINPKIEKTVSGSPYVNERDADFIREYIGTPVEATPFPVEAESFAPGPYGKYFLYPSRIAPEKRFEKAIEAFRIFSRKEKGWKLVIAGSVPKRERELAYLNQLAELARGADVEFKTDLEQKELKALYSGAYAILYYPINEDWGLPPVEAMASEKPCISVNEGGPKYSIVEGKTGFLVNSPEGMAEKMIYLASHPAETEKMGKAGRKRVMENYTWEIFFKRMENAFREAASPKDESANAPQGGETNRDSSKVME